MFISRMGAGTIESMETPARELPPLFGMNICHRVDNPGLGDEHPDQVDYSLMPVSTPDQQRIETVMEGMDLSRATLLHVGVGNSMLAARFALRCPGIDGVTVSPRERERAAGLGLANYRAVLANKYSPTFPAALGRPYELIIDNNLASFACCEFHLMTMFSSYRLLLRPGGMILTDQQGMDWVAGDPRFRLRPGDLARIGARLGMEVVRLTPMVFAMVRRPGREL